MDIDNDVGVDCGNGGVGWVKGASDVQLGHL